MTRARRSTAWTLALGLLASLAMTAAAQDEAPPADQAMIRFLHAAPNAEIGSVALRSGDDQAAQVEQFAALGYGEVSDYVPITEGGYEVVVNLATVDGEAADAGEVPADALDTFPGEYYTIALIGLVQPEEDAEQDAEGGLVDWLQGLFDTGDDAYTLRALVINDLAPFAFDDTQAEVRLAHLAPGSEAVELVQVTGDGANTIHSVGYAEVSGFGQFVPADGALELRVAGSEAVVLDLSDQQFEAGSSRTVFLIGTPVAEKPLEVIVVDNPAEAATAAARGVPAAPGADPAATPVAVPPAANPAVASDMTFYRDSLNEIEARLAEIEARLDGLLQVDGAEEAATAALQQLEEAMVLLNEARDRLAAQPTPVPAAAPAAPGDADDAN